MKQLAGNKRPESMAKGWQLLCMCVTAFPPSFGFADYLLHYLLAREGTRGAISNYARYCLRTLEGMLSCGAKGLVPTVDEIAAYKERPPILATIELVDGTIVSEELPVTPDLNVGKVLAVCTHALELTDPRADAFGLYVYELPGDPDFVVRKPDDRTPRPLYEGLASVPRPLAAQEYLGSVLVEKVRQRRNFRFVFKRKLFLGPRGEESEDAMYRHLMYLQCEDETIVTGNLVVEREEQAVMLAAISLRVNCGDKASQAEAADVLQYVPLSWRDRLGPTAWRDKVLRMCASRHLAEDVEELKQTLINIVAAQPYFGCHFFPAYKLPGEAPLVARLPRELVLAFNAKGLHILDEDRDQLLQHYGFSDIYKWCVASPCVCSTLSGGGVSGLPL
jgi:hypothetical protein